MIIRTLTNTIVNKLFGNKAIVIIGPRQVGKTTLIKDIIADKNHLFLDGDDPTVRNILQGINTSELKSLIGDHNIVFIDEAQRIENIGLTMKIIIDQIKSVQLLVSGSSAFDLSSKINEPLTGRKWEYQLLPISWEEYEKSVGYLHAQQNLEARLLYGSYPDVINNPGMEKEILKNLVNSYLYKDLLAFEQIRKPEILEKLIQALALQVGSEVSYNEISKMLGIDKNTVSRYIDILEKGFVIFKLNSFGRNLRNEIKMNKKIYFYDNGFRNMIIGNFNPIELRMDKGSLWENFLISERMKQYAYKNSEAKPYFWRTTQQQEVDFVEVNGEKIKAFELKWKEGKRWSIPKTFKDEYNTEGKLISKGNFREFVII